jgi:arylsulfatase A-like enzyme
VTQSFTSAALSFIKQAEQEAKPFYVNVWPDDVHSPFFPPKARRGEGSKRELYHGVLDTMDEQLGVLFSYVRSKRSLRDTKARGQQAGCVGSRRCSTKAGFARLWWLGVRV